MANKVRANSWYTFKPVGWDVTDPAHQGLKHGDRVQVKNLRGCPPANTMGHAHVVDKDGKFMGLVHCNSLVKEEKDWVAVAKDHKEDQAKKKEKADKDIMNYKTGKVRANFGDKSVKEGYYSDLADRIGEEKPKLRLLKTYQNKDGSKLAKVYKDKEWDEHRVKFFKDGQHQVDADHHSDAEDCHSTAKHWVGESVEPVNELKKTTLAKYVRKALDDKDATDTIVNHLRNTGASHTKDSFKAYNKNDTAGGDKHYETAKGAFDSANKFASISLRRYKGIDRALKNLAKESVTDPSPKDLKGLKDKIEKKVGKAPLKDIPTVQPPKSESILAYAKKRVVTESNKPISNVVKKLKLSKQKKGAINTKPSLEIKNKC